MELERFELTDPSAEPSARMVLQVAARPALCEYSSTLPSARMVLQVAARPAGPQDGRTGRTPAAPGCPRVELADGRPVHGRLGSNSCAVSGSACDAVGARVTSWLRHGYAMARFHSVSAPSRQPFASLAMWS